MLKRFAVLIFGRGRSRCVALYRLAAYFHSRKLYLVSYFLFLKLEREYGFFISEDAVVGDNLSLPHPDGIVIGAGVRIDSDVVIYQQVTIGGARRGDFVDNKYPVIGSRSVLFSGARIIGAVTVGEDCIVGANAVVNKDVPARHVAVGIPAVFHLRKDMQ